MYFSTAIRSCLVVAGILAVSAWALPVRAQEVHTETVASGLVYPWAMAFLPDGRTLVTERPGRLRIVTANGMLGPALSGLPAVAAGGQGGLLDVLLDSDFASNRQLYFCFSEPAVVGGGNSTALASARLRPDETGVEAVKILFSQQPKVASSAHFGCRIVEGRQPGTDGRTDGTLFLTLGERFSRKEEAQKLDNHLGKIVRIGKDGSIPPDNPFVGKPGTLPEIWSYGHRNVQGAALTPDGRLWTHEHGPQGGDEINLPAAGANYGWPVITYGENYGGGKIGDGLRQQAGMQQPLHYWVPSIAPSGMAFLTSDRYGKAWQGNLFVGSLKFAYLNRIELEAPYSGKVRREHRLLADMKERIRDVRQGPDGLLYLLTDSASGRLLRLVSGSPAH